MNIEQARFNMIEQQIRTWEVLDDTVLSLLDHVEAGLFDVHGGLVAGRDERTGAGRPKMRRFTQREKSSR